MIKFIEIKDIEYINEEQYVNDIEVETNHNYIANNYIVHNCITTSNVSIHYPQASLIDECYRQRKVASTLRDNLGEPKYDESLFPKIVADGGIRNYDHVIKALALGADYVMIGSVFAQCIESAGEKIIENSKKFENYIEFEIDGKGNWWAYYTDSFIEENDKSWKDEFETAKQEYLNDFNTEIHKSDKYKENDSKYKLAELKYYVHTKKLHEKQFIGNINVKFFGMASADGQKSISGEKTKTAEGITKYLPVKYTLKSWVDNMISYLRSAMSYTNCSTLDEFIGTPDLIINSISEIHAVNK